MHERLFVKQDFLWERHPLEAPAAPPACATTSGSAAARACDAPLRHPRRALQISTGRQHPHYRRSRKLSPELLVHVLTANMLASAWHVQALIWGAALRPVVRHVGAHEGRVQQHLRHNQV